MKTIKLYVMGIAAASLVTPQCLSSVVDYWRFEEGSGFTVSDQTDNANGTLQLFMSSDPAPYWSANVPNVVVPQTGEPNNYSLQLGQTSRVEAFRADPLSLGTQFTIEMYFDFTSAPNFKTQDEPGFFSLFGSGGNIAFGLSGIISNTQTVGYRIQLGAIGNDSSETILYSDPMSPVGWNHLALVADNGTATFYLNGISIGSGALSGQFDFGSNSTIHIGQIGNVPYAYFDEVRISDTALDPSQFLNAIPEPSTFLLTGLALVSLAVLRSRRRREITH